MTTSSSFVRTLAPSRWRHVALIGLRFIILLSLSLWLGGLFFFGAMAAGPMFRIARAAGQGELAPQMVTAMLGRFGWVLDICGVLLVLGWLGERFLAPLKSTLEARLWWLQGAASAAMLGLALYLGVALMPRLTAMQNTVLQGNNTALKLQFDAAHAAYTSLAGVSIYLGFTVLLTFIWRVSNQR